MSKYDDKVIPTLDDVISVGDPDEALIGGFNALEDDFEDDFDNASLNLDTGNDDSLNDDNLDDESFEDEFDTIALLSDDQQDSTEPDEMSVDLFDADDNNQSDTFENFDDSITDLIVAERFPLNVSERPEKKTAPAVRPTPVTDQPASTNSTPQTASAQIENTAAPAPQASPTEPGIKAEILISEVIDEITRELMPEIEWKIRTRVRDILERHFTDKDR